MLGLKPGVRLQSLSPQMALAATIVSSCFQKLGYGCIITSGSDGKHKEGSLHYKGDALDFRSRDVRPTARKRLYSVVRSQLGVDFDVVEESTHMHVEYDPKEIEDEVREEDRNPGGPGVVTHVVREDSRGHPEAGPHTEPDPGPDSEPGAYVHPAPYSDTNSGA